MLYVRRLEIVDENDTSILTIKNQDAVIALNKAIKIISDKDGGKRVNSIFKRFLKDLDDEFKEYFNLG